MAPAFRGRSWLILAVAFCTVGLFSLALICIPKADAAGAITSTVHSITEFNTAIASAGPGSVITIANGTYSNFSADFSASGIAGSPIIIKAESTGGVIFTGTSRLNIHGSYVQIQGISFSNIASTNISVSGNNNSITGNTFSSGGTAGGAQVIVLAAAASVTALNTDISGNTFTGSAGMSIYVYPSTATVAANTSVHNNTFQSITGTQPVIYIGFSGTAAGVTADTFDANTFINVSAPLANINSSGNIVSNTSLQSSAGLVVFGSGTTNTLNGTNVSGPKSVDPSASTANTTTITPPPPPATPPSPPASDTTTTQTTTPSSGPVVIDGVTIAQVTTDTTAGYGFASRIDVSGKTLPIFTTLLPAVKASTDGETMQGTSGNDSLSSGFATGKMIGGLGDDLYSAGSGIQVIENANEGTDEVIAGTAYYKLPQNIENLKGVGTTGQVLIGNELPNLVSSGGSGNYQIDGGPGNDVLTGGTGVDTFVIQKGNGSDVIANFQSGPGGDIVRLHGYGFTTFSAITANMSFFGKDTVLDLGGGEVLVFRNVTPSAFVASNFALPINLSNKYLSFDDEFDSFSRCINDYSSATTSCSGGIWRTVTGFGSPLISAGYRFYPANGEEQINIDPEFPGIMGSKYGPTPLGINPFSVSNGVLTISADKTPTAALPLLNYQPYTSGYIMSQPSFSQTYGYFEMRAKLPVGKGWWPAFWMLSAKGGWPPEIDTLEGYGSKPYLQSTTIHYASGGANQANGFKNDVPDPTADFHQYGVDWQADYITFYFDRVPVYKVATPAQLQNVPMYMIANLTVGGAWDGSPDATTPFPGKMQIDYIRAYSNAPVTKVIGPASSPSSSVITGSITPQASPPAASSPGGSPVPAPQTSVSGGGSSGGAPSNANASTPASSSSVQSSQTSKTFTLEIPIDALLAFLTQRQVIGTKNPQVIVLQKLLNTLGYPVAQNGPGSKGNETTYYGAGTKAAVARFQATSQLTTDSTSVGLAGPKTRAKLLQVYLLNLLASL